jgi:hypothetical protein
MRFSAISLTALAALALTACEQSEQAQYESAMSEVSAVSGLTGMGPKLAEDALIGGKTYRALGQHAWDVMPNGQSAVTSVPIAEYRKMTGNETPIPAGSRRSSVIINIRPNDGLNRDLSGSTDEIEPYAGLRRTVDPAYPETSPWTLWLPQPYDGVIVCPRGAVENLSGCQLKLKRGATIQSVTIPAVQLEDWKLHTDAFIALMDRATAPDVVR